MQGLVGLVSMTHGLWQRRRREGSPAAAAAAAAQLEAPAAAAAAVRCRVTGFSGRQGLAGLSRRRQRHWTDEQRQQDITLELYAIS